MSYFICESCGTQYAESPTPPTTCPVCTDDRQYTGPFEQRWTTHDQLVTQLDVRIEDDDGLIGIGVVQPFAIPQRALLVPNADGGNIMWDCISVVTPEAVDRITRLGGIDLIAISHPHFYSSMIEWSNAFGGVPILIHEDDRSWIRRTSPHVKTWSGDHLELSPTVTLVHLPGHFPGSCALHWNRPDRPVLLTGDSLQVATDRRHVAVMHSVPNDVPAGNAIVSDVHQRLASIEFDDLYGFTWGLNIIGNARQQVDESLTSTKPKAEKAR